MIQLHSLKKTDALEQVVYSMNKAFQRKLFLKDDLGRINLEELLFLLESTNNKFFIAKQGRDLVGGFLRRVLDEHHVEISHFWVDLQFRGQNMGRQILLNMEEKLRKEKTPLVVIIKIIAFHQDRLIQFYEKLGYSYTGLVEHPSLKYKQRFIYPEFWQKIFLKIYKKHIN